MVCQGFVCCWALKAWTNGLNSNNLSNKNMTNKTKSIKRGWWKNQPLFYWKKEFSAFSQLSCFDTFLWPITGSTLPQKVMLHISQKHKLLKPGAFSLR